MKRKAIHRITALTMAFLMFFTSVGFSIDIHYCKGEMKSFSLLGKAESCHAVMKSCPRHAEMQMNDEKGCCSNEKFEVDDLDAAFDITSIVEFTNLNVKLVTAFVFTFYDFSFPSVVKSTLLKTHNPIPPRDIYVLLERFLI